MMDTISIRAYTRRSKTGKTVKVRSYSRSYRGRKGNVSPKGSKSSGEEYEEVKNNQQEPIELGPYAASNAQLLKQRWEALKHGKSAVDSIKRYDDYVRNKQKFTPQGGGQGTAPMQPMQHKSPFMQRVESKISRILEKYSGRKYKKYF